MINDFESFGHFVKSRNNETGEESFWYGQTLEDFDLTDEEAEKLTFLSLDTWTGTDFAYVFGEICETHNSHKKQLISGSYETICLITSKTYFFSFFVISWPIDISVSTHSPSERQFQKWLNTFTFVGY